MIDAQMVEIARYFPIERVIAERGIKLRGKVECVGPCPCCGGRDRFSINTKKQLWNCRGCDEGGDVIALVQLVDGIDFRTAVDLLAGSAIDRPRIAALAPPRPRRENDIWRSIWHEGAPIARTLAERYLVDTRRLEVPADPDGCALRFHAWCPFNETHHPCLLALYRDIRTDDTTGLLRVALDDAARKIDRRALGRIAGAAVKLSANETVTYGLTVAEGLETTFAGMALGFKPAWSVGSAAGIREFPVLAGIDCLTVLVDQDVPDKRGHRAGPEAAQECSARWTAAGREVRRVVPRAVGTDLADIVARAPS